MADSNKNPNNQQLVEFRGAIDAIDDKIVALLRERCGIVKQVGELKRSTTDKECYIRSGREALMHRDVYERFQDIGIHPEAALAIWRHIITASTHMEKPMHVGAPASMIGLVDNYFGSYIPRYTWEGDIPTNATILFAPYPTQETTPYWQAVLESAKPWRIFSYAPLVSNSTTPEALLLACIDAEASGEDISYFTGGTKPANATELACGIWFVPEYTTHIDGAHFLGAHATTILRTE